jgi:ribokinase
MKKRGSIVVLGSSNTDLVISADHFPSPGETIIGSNFMVNPGGKGANQAVAAARLGADVSFIGKVGKDNFGLATIGQLKKEGIDVSSLGVTEAAASGVALITVVPSGENSIIVGSGANSLLTPEDVQAARRSIEGASILLMQMETPQDTLIEAARIAKDAGVCVVLNPAPVPAAGVEAELLRHVDLLVPNETEAAQIAGTESGASSPRQMAEAIQALGVKDVVITLGSKGSYANCGGKEYTVPAHTVKAVDTTAAGDTFCGALCLALAEGRPMDEALDKASGAAAVSVTRKGAQASMPYASEVSW